MRIGVEVIFPVGKMRRVCAFVLVVATLASSFTFGLLTENVMAGTVVGGEITEDTTWTPLGSPYYVVEHLFIRNGATLTIEPGVDVLFDNYKQLMVISGSLIAHGTEEKWITFGPNTTSPYPDYWMGIYVRSEGNTSMSYVDISYASKGIGIGSSNNTLYHCRITHSYINALEVAPDLYNLSARADNNTISRCEFVDNEFYGEYEVVQFIEAHNNTFESNIVANNSGKLGLMLDVSDDNKILSNTFVNNTFNNVWIFYSKRNLVAENLISGGSHGVQIIGSAYPGEEASNNIVRNNTIVDNRFSGISLYYKWNRYNVIENNYISGNGEGIRFPTPSGLVQPVENNTIRYNIITNNRYGFYLRATAWNTSIYGNEIVGNDYGMLISSPHNNTIWNNNISDNSICGLCLEGAQDISMTENRIERNGIGIFLNNSWENEITRNIVSNNRQWGFWLELSILNRIYHNDIINNTQQAYDGSIQSNEWDDGYPSGGNYWSDYTGLDLYSGPNQDIPGSDGIGDDPYVIDSDSWDNYPFTNPTIMPPPSPPTIVSAFLSGSNHKDVTILWNLSSDDGAGLNNVVCYDIFRSTVYDPNKGYQLYDSVPNSTSQYIDIGAAEGDQNNYFYYVCAVNVANNSSCSPNQAGKFTRPLAEGPNLLSIPLIQSNGSIEKVLQTVKFDKAWTYDSSRGKWKWYMTFKPYKGMLRTINHAMGMWINVTTDSNLTVAGVVPLTTSIELKRGWNLVSFPSFEENYTVADLKLEINATKVERFASSNEPYHLAVMQDTEKLRAGYGYWVEVPEDLLWTISN